MNDPLVTLKLAECLPIMKAALDAGEVQAQKEEFNGCSYTGPCIIGTCVPVELREKLDHAPSCYGETDIDTLVSEGIVKVDNQEAFSLLQCLHDNSSPSILIDEVNRMMKEMNL